MTHSDVYHETCSMIRHYSNTSLTIRMATIVQGLIVLSASGYLFRNGENFAAIVASFFGLIFTLFLYILYSNYQRKCEIFIDVASKIEQKIDEKSVRSLTIYQSDHNKKNKNFFGEVFTVKGFFVLMALSFLILIFLSYLLIKFENVIKPTLNKTLYIEFYRADTGALDRMTRGPVPLSERSAIGTATNLPGG